VNTTPKPNATKKRRGELEPPPPELGMLDVAEGGEVVEPVWDIVNWVEVGAIDDDAWDPAESRGASSSRSTA
jgi:hypothetical protein